MGLNLRLPIPERAECRPKGDWLLERRVPEGEVAAEEQGVEDCEKECRVVWGLCIVNAVRRDRRREWSGEEDEGELEGEGEEDGEIDEWSIFVGVVGGVDSRASKRLIKFWTAAVVAVLKRVVVGGEDESVLLGSRWVMG
jgi:predicted PP-loop superfamily ATPase